MLARKLLRSLYIDVASFASSPKNGVYILNGHFAHPKKSDEKRCFFNQLKSLRKNYEFLNIEEAVKIISEGREEKERCISFTFDDGFKDCIDSIAPTLSDFNVNACFFINSGFVSSSDEYVKEFLANRVRTPGKKPMTWDDIKQLDRDGFVIGNHSKDHFLLSGLSGDEFECQVMDSHDAIVHYLEKPCTYFAWPYGKLTDITQEQVDKLRQKYNFIFSGDDYKRYFSFQEKVYNRRHFEPSWPARHVKYFLSHGRR